MGPRASLGVSQKRKSLLPHARTRTPDRSAPCQDAIPTELSPLLDTGFIEVQIVTGLHHQNHHRHYLHRHHNKLSFVVS